MGFVAYRKLVQESKPDYIAYRDRYWSLPDDILKDHNFNYGYYGFGKDDFSNREIVIFSDDERKIALLRIHISISTPGECAPAAYALFFDNEIILIKVSTTKTYSIVETKEVISYVGGGEVYKKIVKLRYYLMSFDVPVSLINKESEIKFLLRMAFECVMQSDHINNGLIEYVESDVLFDQPFESPFTIK